MKKKCSICGCFFSSKRGKTYCNKHTSEEAIRIKNDKQYRKWRPIKKTKCKICGKLFDKIYKRNCCSEKCKQQNRLNISKEWHKKLRQT